MRKILVVFVAVCGSWMAARFVGAQTQVGIPFQDQKGYILELRGAERRMVLDLGENQITSDVSAEMEIAPQVTVVGPKGVPLDATALRTGLEVNVSGERLGGRLVAKTIRVLTEIADDKVKVSGVFEKLDGQVATVGGELVSLGEGVSVIGTNEWKGMTFASFNDMMLGSFVELEGKRGSDGLIRAAKAETWPNLFTKAEVELRKQVGQGLTLPAANQLSGAKVAIGGQEYKLVQDLNIQAYVTRIGYKLIPGYVRDLPADDPGKVTFRFYVIEDPTFNACAYPDGSVFVHTGLLTVLENEAQLAAVLGHEIAHVTYEHGRQQFQTGKKVETGKKAVEIAGNVLDKMGKFNPFKKKASIAGTEVSLTDAINFGTGLFSNIYSRQMEDQADQVGLFYMHEAGYDPREAPKVWRKIVDLTGDQSRLEEVKDNVKTFLYSSHPAAKARLSNLNREIALHWHDTDFSTAVIGEESYHKALSPKATTAKKGAR